MELGRCREEETIGVRELFMYSRHCYCPIRTCLDIKINITDTTNKEGVGRAAELEQNHRFPRGRYVLHQPWISTISQEPLEQLNTRIAHVSAYNENVSILCPQARNPTKPVYDIQTKTRQDIYQRGTEFDLQDQRSSAKHKPLNNDRTRRECHSSSTLHYRNPLSRASFPHRETTTHVSSFSNFYPLLDPASWETSTIEAAYQTRCPCQILHLSHSRP